MLLAPCLLFIAEFQQPVGLEVHQIPAASHTPNAHLTRPQVYRILMRTSAAVQPLSCDEAYLDVTGLGDPEAIAARLRSEIRAATGCPASAGIGPNPLLARLVGCLCFFLTGTGAGVCSEGGVYVLEGGALLGFPQPKLAVS